MKSCCSTWLSAGLLALLLTGPAFADQHIYVWNRNWTPAVRRAVADFTPDTQGWRVLAAERDARGRLTPMPVDWRALKDHPVTAVIRIDGQLSLGSPDAVMALVRGLPANAAIEIDHDCATARLADYGRFLKALRGRIGPRRLSITALPAWLNAGALDDVLAATDEVVLQVHAVRRPREGLFDVASARAWSDALARRTQKPFRVAVPDYGSQVIRDSADSIIAIESEAPRLAGGASAQELMARPADVAAFVRDVTAHPPPHFAGLAWFRLPVAGDARIWSPATLRLVMRGRAPTGTVSATLLPSSSGASDLVLQNDGDKDLPLPARLRLPRGCGAADAVNGYALRATGGEYSFARLQNTLLRAHHRRIVGWARCVEVSPQIEVVP